MRRGGVGTHFVIHRYFFDRSPHWKEIREEESRAENALRQSESTAQEDDIPDDEGSPDAKTFNFSPIDARHLSSLPLLRGRVIRLLKASRNQMHAANNILLSIVGRFQHFFGSQ